MARQAHTKPKEADRSKAALNLLRQGRKPLNQVFNGVHLLSDIQTAPYQRGKSMNFFKGWRFIVTHNNEIVFANGVLPAITKADFFGF